MTQSNNSNESGPLKTGEPCIDPSTRAIFFGWTGIRLQHASITVTHPRTRWNLRIVDSYNSFFFSLLNLLLLLSSLFTIIFFKKQDFKNRKGEMEKWPVASYVKPGTTEKIKFRGGWMFHLLMCAIKINIVPSLFFRLDVLRSSWVYIPTNR
jgi:hypothetical protein